MNEKIEKWIESAVAWIEDLIRAVRLEAEEKHGVPAFLVDFAVNSAIGATQTLLEIVVNLSRQVSQLLSDISANSTEQATG